MRKLNEQELVKVISERGYLVFWSAVPIYIGKQLQTPEITDIHSLQRFVVIAETDKNDHDEQLKMLGEAPQDFPYCDQIVFRFYRVTTD